MSKKLPLAEIFGPTIQGEGNRVGEKVYFIRFAGCDFRCAWCDSKYTHIIKENTEWGTTEELLERVRNLPGKADSIVITGGNPALYDLSDFVKGCNEMGLKTHIETQGTKFPEWLLDVDYIVISPKGPSSGMHTRYDLDELVENIESLADRRDQNRKAGYLPHSTIVLKTPIFNDEDYEWTKTLFNRINNVDRKYFSVGNEKFLPTEETPTVVSAILQKYRWLADKICEDDELTDVATFPQQHALIWGTMLGK